jgi:hypothetical protein
VQQEQQQGQLLEQKTAGGHSHGVEHRWWQLHQCLVHWHQLYTCLDSPPPTLCPPFELGAAAWCCHTLKTCCNMLTTLHTLCAGIGGAREADQFSL